MDAMNTRFLDSFLECEGNGSKPLVTLRDFFERAELKDLFEFAVYCNDIDHYHIRDFLGYIDYLCSDYCDITYEDNEKLMEYYEGLLDDFMKERNIVLQKAERPYRRYVITKPVDALGYVFDLYNKDYERKGYWHPERFYVGHLGYFLRDNRWVSEVNNKLEDKVNEVFIREWNKLKERFAEYNTPEWKDRAMLLGVDFLNDEALYQNDIHENYNYHGLQINKQFISDNNLISVDELCDWLEGVVNLALKESGIKYNEEKVSYLEKLTDKEEEAEPELER